MGAPTAPDAAADGAPASFEAWRRGTASASNVAAGTAGAPGVRPRQDNRVCVAGVATPIRRHQRAAQPVNALHATECCRTVGALRIRPGGRRAAAAAQLGVVGERRAGPSAALGGAAFGSSPPRRTARSLGGLGGQLPRAPPPSAGGRWRQRPRGYCNHAARAPGAAGADAAHGQGGPRRAKRSWGCQGWAPAPSRSQPRHSTGTASESPEPQDREAQEGATAALGAVSTCSGSRKSSRRRGTSSPRPPVVPGSPSAAPAAAAASPSGGSAGCSSMLEEMEREKAMWEAKTQRLLGAAASRPSTSGGELGLRRTSLLPRPDPWMGAEAAFQDWLKAEEAKEGDSQPSASAPSTPGGSREGRSRSARAPSTSPAPASDGAGDEPGSSGRRLGKVEPIELPADDVEAIGPQEAEEAEDGRIAEALRAAGVTAPSPKAVALLVRGNSAPGRGLGDVDAPEWASSSRRWAAQRLRRKKEKCGLRSGAGTPVSSAGRSCAATPLPPEQPDPPEEEEEVEECLEESAPSVGEEVMTDEEA
eukprot:CAMPEP_0180419138 /NCGR_PEP_ID=MMETSP1036_2-20121128/1932_1 /TAXON_ID=632150 /ORGANISM="Azadinium spinosum, Strain 3D9" /LENGTH=533 /DNA_ID=CAMNT_0022424265 /DNA_START=125 /DNA_END=1725 /DNA_ORIENTATION=+